MFAALTPNTDVDLFEQLLDIHDAVTQGAVPIDYARRRRAFPCPVPLARRTATRTAGELQLRPTPPLARFMSWWIYERLSGNDVLLQPDLPGAIRLTYARQRTAWDTEPPRRLLLQAQHALLVNGIDEPITWMPLPAGNARWACPPADLIRQLDWSNRPSRHSAQPDSRPRPVLGTKRSPWRSPANQPTPTGLRSCWPGSLRSPGPGGLTDAARSIGISQPTLSVGMRNLEKDFGTTLLDRSHRAVALTEQSHLLLRALRQRPITHVSASSRPGDAARSLNLSTEGAEA